ncbi:MAG: hypothetical protein K2Q01_00430 [Rickettsiales bacterium]|nr:hypothetical protein [Rickettsiales bacterium]
MVLVLDDFHRPEIAEMQRHFDFIRPFKTHYVYRKAKGMVAYVSHHRRALRRALKEVRVGILDVRQHTHAWQSLYDDLTRKLELSGLHAFPIAHIEEIAGIEGVTAIGAWHEDALVSAHIWVSDGTYAHSHLVASNQKGYDTQAAYAVNDFAIRHFSRETLLNFGGGAGLNEQDTDGLARFKRGFSNDTAQSHLCGVVLDKERYAALCMAKEISPETAYFPAYRS